MKTRHVLSLAVIAVVLLGVAAIAQTSRRDDQASSQSEVLVVCGDCPGSYFQLTAERGMLLMKTGHNAGDLWFYPFTPGAAPIAVGRLPAVGKPIAWERHVGTSR